MGCSALESVVLFSGEGACCGGHLGSGNAVGGAAGVVVIALWGCLPLLDRKWPRGLGQLAVCGSVARVACGGGGEHVVAG